MPGTLQELRVTAYLDLLQERDSRGQLQERDSRDRAAAPVPAGPVPAGEAGAEAGGAGVPGQPPPDGGPPGEGPGGPGPGILIWRTPAGRSYDTTPTRYPE